MKALILALALSITACGHDDATTEGEYYLDMVCLHESTGQGWPDYKNLTPDCEERRGPEIGYNP